MFTVMLVTELVQKVVNKKLVLSAVDADRLSRWFRWVPCRCRWNNPAESARVEVKFSSMSALSVVAKSSSLKHKPLN
jgi:hypothetical protein